MRRRLAAARSPLATRTLTRNEAMAVLAALAALVVVNVPELGSDAWPFRTGRVEGSGPLGPLVRAADGEWNLGVLRSAALLAGVLLVLLALYTFFVRAWRAEAMVAVAAVVVALLLLPAVLLQVGLRDASAPWFHTNDSTYQIELAGDVLLEGSNPYGHDYRFSGLERFYSRNGTVQPGTRERQVALRHLAYFPGTTLTAAAWRTLPRPWSDYRLFVALATLALFFAVLTFPAPLPWRIALGAVAAANPLAVRAAWFGTADAPSILLLVVAFVLLARSRYVLAAAVLAGAVLLKQFALVALPFFAVAMLYRARRAELWRAGAAFAAILAAGFLPFLVADPGALWRDTVTYGAETYRIVGYGLSNILLRLGIVEDREGYYPFLPLALAIWAPFTALLLLAQVRSRALWSAASGFAASMFVLLYLARAFQTSHLIWPFVGLVVAVLLALSRPAERAPAARPARERALRARAGAA